MFYCCLSNAKALYCKTTEALLCNDTIKKDCREDSGEYPNRKSLIASWRAEFSQRKSLLNHRFNSSKQSTTM